MDRRDVLGVLGMAAAGLAAGSPGREAAGADEPHGEAPVDRFHLYLCAFHIAKQDPNFQIEAHHYCSAADDEVHQCVTFDSSGKNARILGVGVHHQRSALPRPARWGEEVLAPPHLRDPLRPARRPRDARGRGDGADARAADDLGQDLAYLAGPATRLPVAEPLLMCSSTKDGQIDPALLADRDQRLGIATREIRRRRTHLGPVPQVDPPKSLDAIGRQWTNEGPDAPPRR